MTVRRLYSIARPLAWGVLLFAWMLAGCAQPDAAEQFARALRTQWKRVPARDFPPPSATPYDSSAHRRAQYLRGYRDGIRAQLKQRRRGEMEFGDSFARSDDPQATCDGYRDAALAISEKADAVIEAVTKELPPE